MTAMREQLANDLRSKIERHRVVVWVDPHGEYADAADSVVPSGVHFDRFDGSWYALRRRIEPVLAAAEPRLVVYVDQPAPDEDPLEELRRTGTEYRIRLSTLLRRCLETELPTTKIDELASVARTLTEAESILASGAGGGPARLVRSLGTSEPTELVLMLVDENARLETDDEFRQEAMSFLATQLGLANEPDAIATKLAQQLVLVEIEETVGALPAALRTAVPEMRSEQRRLNRAVLERWGGEQRRRGRFLALMAATSTDLQLQHELTWHENMGGLDTVPAYDELAFGEYLRRLDIGRFVEAEELSAARLSSLWSSLTEPDTKGRWHERWAVAHASAQLLRLLDSRVEPDGRVTPILESYVAAGWRIDRAHRRMELALHNMFDREPLEAPVRAARHAYDTWLDSLLRSFVDALETEGLSERGAILAQGSIHASIVAPLAKVCPVAYFMVDALRYDLGQDLAEALRRQFPDGNLGIAGAVTVLPSITPVGMANLCPGADDGLELRLDDQDRLLVLIDGRPVMRPPDRVARLQAAHGQVSDLRLDELFQLSERELGERIAGANIVLVRSQEIDEAGESGKIAAQFKSFEMIVQMLARSVARLAHRGIRQFVIASDHGFLALTRDLGGHMTIPKPGGRGEVHRRAFVGRGGAAGGVLARIPLSKVGLPGDLDVLVPRGLALIAAGGSRGFFHGGASPQEVLVPVLTLEVKPPAGTVQTAIEVALAPRITSQVFLAKLELQQDLLSGPLDVRLVPARQSDGMVVGVLATTDAGDDIEGLVRLQPGTEINVGFRLTTSLSKGDKVELQVYDARTDRQLATSKPATAARALEVDDEFA
jgi:hypothetical protein